MVGPGVSTFYLQGSVTTGWPAAVLALFNALKGFVPPGVTWTIPGTVDILDEATGEITGVNTPGGGGTVASSAPAGDYKPGVGARIRWQTSGIVGGRKVQGTTFLVPVMSAEIPNGTLSASLASTGVSAPATYRQTAGITPAIYSRPRPAHVKNGVTIPARAGSCWPIVGNTMPNSLTWLRTRRT